VQQFGDGIGQATCTDVMEELLIGLLAPIATQRSMTSWQRRSISGLSRCTLAKSRSSALSPEATELAAPPPRPISIAGPPSTMTASPACSGILSTCTRSIAPRPPASMIGLS